MECPVDKGCDCNIIVAYITKLFTINNSLSCTAVAINGARLRLYWPQPITGSNCNKCFSLRTCVYSDLEMHTKWQGSRESLFESQLWPLSGITVDKASYARLISAEIKAINRPLNNDEIIFSEKSERTRFLYTKFRSLAKKIFQTVSTRMLAKIEDRRSIVKAWKVGIQEISPRHTTITEARKWRLAGRVPRRMPRYWQEACDTRKTCINA